MDDRSLARYFADLAETLLAVNGVGQTMNMLVNAAVEAVDGAEHASLSHMRGRAMVSASSNDDIGQVLDAIQTGADEGPCLDAIRTGEIQVAGDLRDSTDWPRYGPAAVDSTGVPARTPTRSATAAAPSARSTSSPNRSTPSTATSTRRP